MADKIPNELLEIIEDGEGVTTEFKESKTGLPKNLFETVCAFLNRNGGHIFLGISDNGKIVGIDEEYIKNMKIKRMYGNQAYKFLFVFMERVHACHGRVP